MNTTRPYVAPADVFARYEKSGLVKYTRAEVLAAAAEIDTALTEMDAVASAAASLVIAAKDADAAEDIARNGRPDPLWDIFAAEYHPELAVILGLLNNQPSLDWGGTGSNNYPVPTWLKKATAIRHYAARLRKAVVTVAARHKVAPEQLMGRL